MATENLQILLDYNEGRRSLQNVLHHCRSYAGPARQFLCDKSPFLRSIYYSNLFHICLDRMSETKMFELLQALIDDNPAFPLILDQFGMGFLEGALGGIPYEPRAASPRIICLLAVPGTTRCPARTGQFHTLHFACHQRGIDPVVVNHLIDLDPDVLVEPGFSGRVPLHCALEMNPTSSFVARMVELRPESLLCRDNKGRSPVALACHLMPDRSHEAAQVLQGLVLQCPGSVSSTPSTDGTALWSACWNLHTHHDLIKTIVQAYPPALAFAWKEYDVDREYLLPFEVGPAGTRLTAAFLEEDTLEVALAVVEYALGTEVGQSPRRARGGGGGIAAVVEADDPVWFLGHARRTAVVFLHPTSARDDISGLAAAETPRRAGPNPPCRVVPDVVLRRMGRCRPPFPSPPRDP
jgi:hypothetical protein